jgi:hypothetical protein
MNLSIFYLGFKKTKSKNKRQKRQKDVSFSEPNDPRHGRPPSIVPATNWMRRAAVRPRRNSRGLI